MAENGKILTQEAEQALLAPIDAYVGGIQQKINALRADGTDKVIALTNHIAIVRENANYTKEEKASDHRRRTGRQLAEAKAVEAKNKAQINTLIDDAVSYLDANYDQAYYSRVAASCAAQKEAETARYARSWRRLKSSTKRTWPS